MAYVLSTLLVTALLGHRYAGAYRKYWWWLMGMLFATVVAVWWFGYSVLIAGAILLLLALPVNGLTF